MTIENIATLSSLLFFSLTLIIYYVLISRLLGWAEALLATNLCVVVPPTLGRSMVGFADRDAFCLFLAFTSFYLYIKAQQTTQGKSRLILGLLSGLFMMVLGLAWQGVGLFINIIVLLNFTIFLFGVYRRTDFYLYLAWLSPVVIGLLGFSSMYQYVSRPYVVLAIGLPCGFSFLVLFWMVIAEQPKLSELFTLGRKIPSSLATTAITVVTIGLVGFVLSLVFQDIFDFIGQAWERFLAPFGSGAVTTSTQELQKRGALGWSIWPGYFLILIAAGVLLLVKRAAETTGLNIWLSLFLFEILLAGTILTRLAWMEDSAYESPLMTSLYIQ